MKQKLLKYGSIALLLYAGIFFSCLYNYHLLYAEQLQVFQFSSLYFHSLAAKPGGIAAWAGEFLMQFYALDHAAGIILLLCLLLLFFLLEKLSVRLKAGGYFPWGVVPAMCFAFFFLDVQAQVGSLLAATTAVGAALLLTFIRPGWVRQSVALGLIPAIYWCTGGGGLIYAGLLISCHLAAERVNRPYLLLILLLSAGIPLLIREYVLPLSWGDTWVGTGFYRADAFPRTVWWLIALPALVPLAARLTGKAFFLSRRGTALLSVAFLLMAGGSVAALQHQRNEVEEAIYALDHLLKKGEWEQMAQTALRKPYRNSVFVAYANLALLNTGRLNSDLFHFAQRKDANEFWTSAYLPMFLTGELYYQLDMTNAARAYIFMANTQSPKGQMPFLYRRLAEIEIVRGNPQASLRYIEALKHTLFYRRWAEETEQYVSSGNYPEALQRKINDYGPNTSFLAKELLYNLACKHEKSPANAKVTAFLLAKYLLANDHQGFLSCLSRLPAQTGRELPGAFQEFLLMYAYRIHDNSLIEQWNIGREVVERFYQYLQINQSGKPAEAIRESLSQSFGSTYWFYFQYTNNNQLPAQ